MIYLDNAATTSPKPEEVRLAINDQIKNYSANPGRSGHDMSMKASEVVYECRENLQKLFNAPLTENIIFTNNCTMSLNSVIKGILKAGDHVIISCLEHNSVVRPIEKLAEIGVTYSISNVYPENDDKTVEEFEKLIQPATKLIVCTHASNVFGIVLPIAKIAELGHSYNIPICVDAAQTAGVLSIDVAKMGIDYLCAPGHKGLYGPMGTGILIINTFNDAEIIDSLVEGGTGSLSAVREQPEFLPDKLESGTLNVTGIAGLNAGVKFIEKYKVKNVFNHEMPLIQNLYDALTTIPKIKLFTNRPYAEYYVPILSFILNGMNSEWFAQMLNDRYQIAVRAGLQCAPLAHEYMGTTEYGTVRVSPSIFTTENNIKTLIEAIKRISLLR